MSLTPRARSVRLMLVVAFATHGLLVLAFPRALMALALSRIEARAGTNHAYAAPRPDHTFRAVVRPSPDLLYSVCVLDLAAAGGAIDVEATLPATYGSIAVYDAATDVVDVLRDRDFTDGEVRVRIESAGTHPPAPSGVRVVRLGSSRGLLLQRVLVPDDASAAAVDRIRRGLTCRPAAHRFR